MAEQFHGGVCGGSLWNNYPASRGLFNPSPCSYDVGSFAWTNNHHDLAAEMASISDDSAGAGSAASDSSVVIQGAGDGQVSAASTLEMMGINLPSSTDAWNQGLLGNNGRSEDNYLAMNKNFYGDSFINDFHQMNQSYPLEQQQSAVALSGGFPLNSSSYSYNSSLLQTLFDADFLQPGQPLSDNRAANSNYSATPNYQMNLSEILPNFSETSHMVKTANSLPKKQPGNHSQFGNNTAFWNATAAVLPSVQPQFRPPSLATTKPNLRHSNPKNYNKEAPDLAPCAKKISNESSGNKRARVETASTVPPFKVRKEKLGDRITALQQLVSPFGKTDTASVLQEAIEYIKFLHDQVNVFSAPYLKNGCPPLQHQQVADDHKMKDKKGPMKDLSSRGLCLVPISSTFPVASETTSDFWTPTFGGGFR